MASSDLCWGAESVRARPRRSGWRGREGSPTWSAHLFSFCASSPALRRIQTQAYATSVLTTLRNGLTTLETPGYAAWQRSRWNG